MKTKTRAKACGNKGEKTIISLGKLVKRGARKQKRGRGDGGR